MLKNGKKECGFADDVVAYLYDELAQSERSQFESHLAGCRTCTDEFAGISNARFSVFEWQREEFGPLPTPEIVIPYETKPVVAAASDGWFARLRGLVTLFRWSTASVVAAILVVCIGVGFLAFNYVSSGSQRVGVEVPVAIQEKPEQTATAEVIFPKTPNTTVGASNERELRPVRASIKDRKPPMPKSLKANFQKPQNIPTNRMADQAKKPVLSTPDDDDDRSLRLADLVDDGGA
jgi:anti-sigma factor RsiW